MWDSAFCGAGINIPPVIVEMKNLMKDLKGLLGEFRGWPTVELFSVRLAGLSAEDGKGICWGFVSWLLGIMKSCRWDIGDWWMVIWMGSEGRT